MSEATPAVLLSLGVRIEPAHLEAINSVALGQVNGRILLATGGDDGTARLWDPTTGQPIHDALTGHTGWVRSVAFGEVDGRTLLATAGNDGTVRLWDPTTDQPIQDPLTGHMRPVLSVAFGLVNGQTLLVSGGADGVAVTWRDARDRPAEGVTAPSRPRTEALAVQDDITTHDGLHREVLAGHLYGLLEQLTSPKRSGNGCSGRHYG